MIPSQDPPGKDDAEFDIDDDDDDDLAEFIGQDDDEDGADSTSDFINKK